MRWRIADELDRHIRGFAYRRKGGFASRLASQIEQYREVETKS